MRNKTKESLLASTFLIAILGMLHFQDKSEPMFNPSTGIIISSKVNQIQDPLLQQGKPNAHLYPHAYPKTTVTTTYSTSSKRPKQILLQDYTVPEEEMIITEYTKIVTPEQEEQIRKQYEEMLQPKEENKESKKETNGKGKKNNKDNMSTNESENLIEIPIHPTNLGRIPLPAVYENLADIVEPMEEDEIPFFWHVPRGGGSTVKDIMGGCLDITAASDVGARGGHAEDEVLNVIRMNGGKYVNVDATTIEGIERMKQFNAIESGFIEVVVSPRLFAASTLFTPMYKGRMFAMFRDPIERAVSMFYYLGYAKWEKTYDPDLVLYELQDYAKTNQIENNWMVRSLTNKMQGYLTYHDLQTAKEVLRRKCLIGLMTEKHASMQRFEQFFGWEDRAKVPGVEECREKLLSWGWPNKHKHPMLEPGTEAYQLLQTKNALDIELYEYAKLLFVQQGLYFGLPGSTSLSISYLPYEPIHVPKMMEKESQGDDMI